MRRTGPVTKSVLARVACLLAAATCALAAGAAQARLMPATAAKAGTSATCADYPNQKAAQEAADTRDADGDGIYCVIYSR
jgi:hypothetical protein